MNFFFRQDSLPYKEKKALILIFNRYILSWGAIFGPRAASCTALIYIVNEHKAQ
jgi:hypothetical protein